MKKFIGTLVVCFILSFQLVSAQKSRGEAADTTKKERKMEAPGSPAPEIFTVVEDMPQFPGGEKAMMLFVANNIKYPKKALEEGAQGRVIVKFVVNKEGEVVDAKVLKGIGYGCDEEALRVINSMPKWKPGKQRGKAVNVYYTLPVRFELK